MAGTVMLTVFLKHDQSQNLEQIQSHLEDQDWWHGFPPEGAEILSWNVVMGIGQVVTLRMPPEILPKVNVELERRAWGVFSTEFFPTYDFLPVRERLTRESDARKAAKADGGAAVGGAADGGAAGGGAADGGKADGGKADGGKADGGKADGGKADGDQA